MNPHLEAEIQFLTTSEGGRRGPVFSGYQAQLLYGDTESDVILTFPKIVRVNPGDRALATVTFLRVENHKERIRKGMVFEIRAKGRTIANGCVTWIFEKSLFLEND